MKDTGVYRKFDVRRTDGSDQPGGKHHQCAYFVLDLDHDHFALAALRAYATACREKHPALADDLDAIANSPKHGFFNGPGGMMTAMLERATGEGQ